MQFGFKRPTFWYLIKIQKFRNKWEILSRFWIPFQSSNIGCVPRRPCCLVNLDRISFEPLTCWLGGLFVWVKLHESKYCFSKLWMPPGVGHKFGDSRNTKTHYIWPFDMIWWWQHAKQFGAVWMKYAYTRSPAKAAGVPWAWLRRRRRGKRRRRRRIFTAVLLGKHLERGQTKKKFGGGLVGAMKWRIFCPRGWTMIGYNTA